MQATDSRRKRGYLVLGLAVVVLAFALVASGCGGGATTTTAGPATTAAPTTTTAAPTTTTAAPTTTTAGPTTTAGAASAGAKILFVQKLIGIPYCDRQADGAKWATADFGMEVTYTGPNKPDVTGQITIIEDYLAKGIQGLAVSSNDSAASAPVMKKAMEMGVKTIAWDVPGAPGAFDYEVLAVADQPYGEAIIDQLVKYMGPEGEYAIITGGLNAENLNTWIKYGQDYAKAKYPGLKLVTDIIPSEEQEQIAYQKALEVIKAYPNLKGIVAYSSPALPGVAKAIQEKGLQDKIAAVGQSLPSQVKDFILDGSADASLLYDPAITDYVASYIFKVWLDGGMLEDGMPMMKGKAAVDAGLVIPDTIPLKGKTFTASDPLVFDKSNIEVYAAQGW
jgi:simple sugar transport system substrate-binding protein